MPSRIKKPSEVFGAGGWLEYFQLAYGVSEMMHKSKTRQLAGQKYATDAMDSVYAEYKQTPYSLPTIDRSIDSYEKIMSNLYWDKDSPQAVKAIGQLDTLKQAREDVNIRQSWIEDVSNKYKIDDYADIPNAEGWISSGGTWKQNESNEWYFEKSEQKMGDSETVKKLDLDIKDLQMKRINMKANNQYDPITDSLFADKIKELEMFKSYTGYDGQITQFDVRHAADNKTLSQTIDKWVVKLGQLYSESTHNDSRRSRLDEAKTKNPDYVFSTSEDAFYDNFDEIQEGISKEIEPLEAQLKMYNFDYYGIKNPTLDEFFDEVNPANKTLEQTMADKEAAIDLVVANRKETPPPVQTDTSTDSSLVDSTYNPADWEPAGSPLSMTPTPEDSADLKDTNWMVAAGIDSSLGVDSAKTSVVADDTSGLTEQEIMQNWISDKPSQGDTVFVGLGEEDWDFSLPAGVAPGAAAATYFAPKVWRMVKPSIEYVAQAFKTPHDIAGFLQDPATNKAASNIAKLKKQAKKLLADKRVPLEEWRVYYHKAKEAASAFYEKHGYRWNISKADMTKLMMNEDKWNLFNLKQRIIPAAKSVGINARELTKALMKTGQGATKHLLPWQIGMLAGDAVGDPTGGIATGYVVYKGTQYSLKKIKDRTAKLAVKEGTKQILSKWKTNPEIIGKLGKLILKEQYRPIVQRIAPKLAIKLGIGLTGITLPEIISGLVGVASFSWAAYDVYQLAKAIPEVYLAMFEDEGLEGLEK